MPEVERRNVNRMWWLVTFVVVMLVVQYAANKVLIDGARKDLQAAEERRTRADNEVLALAWCCASKLDVPHLSDPGPKLVRPIDLVESFRDSSAYAGVEVVVPVRVGEVDGKHVRWYGSNKDAAASIVFRFAENPVVKVDSMVWIVGTCKGKQDDGNKRTNPKVTFVVIVDDCQIVGGK